MNTYNLDNEHYCTELCYGCVSIFWRVDYLDFLKSRFVFSNRMNNIKVPACPSYPLELQKIRCRFVNRPGNSRIFVLTHMYS